MNPEIPNDSREALEISLTALILGELPEPEAEKLRQRLAADPELQTLHRKLALAAQLVKEVTIPGPAHIAQPAAPELRLEPARREKLLSYFRTVPLPEPVRRGRRSTAWLLPVAMAALIFLFAAALFLPALSKAKYRALKYASYDTAATGIAPVTEGEASGVQELGRRGVAFKTSAANGPHVSFANNSPSSPPGFEARPGNAPQSASGATVYGGGAYGQIKDLAIPGQQPPPPAAARGGTVQQRSADFARAGDALADTVGKPVTQQKVDVFLPPTTDSFQVTDKETTVARVQAQIDPGPGLPLKQTLQADSTAVPASAADELAPLQLKLPAPAFKGRPMDIQPAPGGQAGLTAGGSSPSSGGRLGFAPAGGIGGGGGGIASGQPAQERVAERYDQPAITAGQPLQSRDYAAAAESAQRALNAGSYFWAEQDGSKAQRGLAETESLGRTTWAAVPAEPAAAVPGALVPQAPTASTRPPVTGLAATAASPSLAATPSQTAPPVLGDLPTLGKTFAGRASQEGRQMVEGQAQAEKKLGLGYEARRLAEPAAAIRGEALEGALAQAESEVARQRPKEVGDELSERVDAPAEMGSRAYPARQDDGALAFGLATNAVTSTAEPEARMRFMRRYGLSSAAAPSAAPAKAAGVALQEEDRKLKQVVQSQPEDNVSNLAIAAPARPAPVPQPEVQTADNPFSTFSLNVSDVSYRLAAAALEKGVMPDPAGIRSEEFINAFDYRDPEPAPGAPVALAWERARYPFAHNREVLRFSVKTAAAGRPAGRAMNLVLLLDNSGSMERADRVQIIREALRVLATQLQPQDRLSVVTFARTATLRVDGMAGDQAAGALEEIGQLTPEGGTNLEEAMNVAYATAKKHYAQSGINRVVLLTDGAANLGNVNPDLLKSRVEAERKQGIALDCFGIGWEGYNDDMLEVLSRNGDGRYAFINTPEAAATDFAAKLAGALQIAASDVKVQVEFNPQRVSVYRQVGYAKHQLTKEQFRDNRVDAAEIAAKEAGNAVYLIQTNPEGNGPVGYVRVRYKVPGTEFVHEHEWAIPYDGGAVDVQDATPAMRLAASASAFSEWLAGNPWAAEATPGRILPLLQGVPEVYGSDTRPAQFVSMVRQAQRLAGK